MSLPSSLPLPISEILRQKHKDHRKKTRNLSDICLHIDTTWAWERLNRVAKSYQPTDQLNPGEGKSGRIVNDDDIEKILATSEVLKPDFMQKTCLTPYFVNKKKAKEMRKKESEKTKGPGWFNMKAPELTEEAKRDLEVLQMRSVLDPKRHYKNDMKVRYPGKGCLQVVCTTLISVSIVAFMSRFCCKFLLVFLLPPHCFLVKLLKFRILVERLMLWFLRFDHLTHSDDNLALYYLMEH
ncbi:Deoxynucleotidyltransferase terminal-interacting protein 2 [Portunus trituberculatus]|uniref:Deoxynucleotidyltransferase terminal-interacting protein 2 n=1 Tax=Portunus trituberculatus TaxID=210409 RepID=A0A5B7HC98_PORTR|nr:Deoxynucleotidyltransferase terminal-interacting protein 2 [Portunus trituberculatus]